MKNPKEEAIKHIKKSWFEFDSVINQPIREALDIAIRTAEENLIKEIIDEIGHFKTCVCLVCVELDEIKKKRGLK